MSAKQKRQQRVADAIGRLASLYPYGALMAETDPAGLLNAAADEIETARKPAAQPAATDAQYECEHCGGTEPEEITGGWRCAACKYRPPECTCYEMTGGHQPGCAFNAALGTRADGGSDGEAE